MAPVKTPVDDLKARIEELEQQNALMEKGALATREKIRNPDGKTFLVDNTRQSIERNKRWIADLRALASRVKPPARPSKTA